MDHVVAMMIRKLACEATVPMVLCCSPGDARLAVLDLIAAISSIPRDRLTRLTERQWPPVAKACAQLSEAPLHIDDSARGNIGSLRLALGRLAREHDLVAAVVTAQRFMQLMTHHREAEVALGLRDIAARLRIAVVVVAPSEIRHLIDVADAVADVADAPTGRRARHPA